LSSYSYLRSLYINSRYTISRTRKNNITKLWRIRERWRTRKGGEQEKKLEKGGEEKKGEQEKYDKKLDKKNENDPNIIKIQISDLKTKVFELENERGKLQVLLSDKEEQNKLLGKNILGKFTNGELVDNEGRCVYIADSTKGDLTFLQVKNTTKCNPIFSYEPNYKQISVKVGTSTKCIDAFNENEIVLNDCIKNSQKQKFDYYPLFNGKFKSQLYSKCLSYNKESNILQLKQCDVDESIVAKDSDKYLYLENV